MQKKKSVSNQNSTIVVLTQRRCMSSMVSGILHKLGVPMGLDEKELETSSERNEWGFYEDLEIVRLSERIMKFTKENPQHTFARIELEFEDEIKEVIGKRKHQQIWGFKDVNQMQTHRLFKKHLTNPRYLVLFRNPLDVAISIMIWRKRYEGNDSTAMVAVQATLEQYMVLLELVKTIQEPMQFISAERLKQNPEDIVKEIISFLKISPTEEQIKSAIDHVKN